MMKRHRFQACVAEALVKVNAKCLRGRPSKTPPPAQKPPKKGNGHLLVISVSMDAAIGPEKLRNVVDANTVKK